MECVEGPVSDLTDWVEQWVVWGGGSHWGMSPVLSWAHLTSPHLTAFPPPELSWCCSSAEGGQGAGGFQETRSEQPEPAVRVSGRDTGCDHNTALLQSSSEWVQHSLHHTLHYPPLSSTLHYPPLSSTFLLPPTYPTITREVRGHQPICQFVLTGALFSNGQAPSWTHL